MGNTLILVENIKEKAAYILGSIISCAKVERMSSDVNYENYSNVIIMLDKNRIISDEVNINGIEKKFLDHLLDIKIKLFDKKLKIAVLFETNEVSSLNEVILLLKDTVIGVQNCIFINKDVENDAVFSAIDLCEELKSDSENEDVNKSDNEDVISNIIDSNSVLSLSTSISDLTSTIPLEYVYIDNNIYIASNVGDVFSNVYVNDKVSFSILNTSDLPIVNSVAGSGRADVLELESLEYKDVISNIKMIEKLNSLDLDTYIIKILPENLKLFNI